MKSKLFLIRRDNREFLGPMSIDDLRRRLTRLEFGMQDEVSGHCGPWVILDQKEELTLHYPDIAGIIGDGLPLSWRETTGHARVISKQDSRNEKVKHKHKQKHETEGFNQFLRKQRRKSNFLKTSSLILIISAVLVAGVILTRKDDLPNLNEMTTLANKTDPSDFLNAMGMKVIPNVSRIVKSQKNLPAWLPLLRMYAFYTTGVIDGLSPKLLKGDLGSNAPADCSVDYWKKKWRESAGQIVQTVQGKSLQKNQWTKILFMDPNWAKRRAVKGWSKPKNYYEGCLMTASLAIRSLAGETGLGANPQDGMTPDIVAAVSRRLQSQLELISSGKITNPIDKSSLQGGNGAAPNLLGALSCLDSQVAAVDIEGCRIAVEPSYKSVFDEHYMMSLLRILTIPSAVTVDAKFIADLQANLPKIAAEDLMAKFDQNAEIKLLGLVAGGTPVEQAMIKTEQEFIDIKWR